MKTITHETVLGELVVAAFDEAAHWSSDPTEISRLATRLVRHMLRHRRKTSHQRDDSPLVLEVSHDIPSAP